MWCDQHGTHTWQGECHLGQFVLTIFIHVLQQFQLKIDWFIKTPVVQCLSFTSIMKGSQYCVSIYLTGLQERTDIGILKGRLCSRVTDQIQGIHVAGKEILFVKKSWGQTVWGTCTILFPFITCAFPQDTTAKWITWEGNVDNTLNSCPNHDTIAI